MEINLQLLIGINVIIIRFKSIKNSLYGGVKVNANCRTKVRKG
jgi:hypothetical protein